MRIGAGIIGLVLLAAQAAHAQGMIAIPLSKPQDNTISVDLVCQKDGRVGPFINTSRLPAMAQRSVHVIASVNIIRNVDVFDGADPNMIHFPATWSFADGPAGSSGLYVSVADLQSSPKTAFADRIRSLTNESQVYILQVLSSHFIGLAVGERRYLAQIDLSGVTSAQVQDCLRFAGFPSALDGVRAALKGPLTKPELKQLCLQTFGYYRALQEFAGLNFGGDNPVPALIDYPLESRADCFSATEKDQDRITAAYLNAAALGLRLDYAGMAAAAHGADIPHATLMVLKRDWAAGELPAVAKAERGKQKADTERRLKYVYLLYARIKSCEEAFRETANRPFTRGELDAYRSTMSQLATQYAADYSADALWSEAAADYPAMLSKMRSSIGLDAKLASDGCARNAGTFEAFSVKLVSTAAKPVKDF